MHTSQTHNIKRLVRHQLHLATHHHMHHHTLGTPWGCVIAATLALTIVWLPLALFFHDSGRTPSQQVKSAQAPPVISVRNLVYGNSSAAYVAHAMGEIDGNIYTNSLDAFTLNYARGFRLFECDLVYLQDGTVFLAHDGHESLYGLDKPFSETTKADIANVRENGKYTPLTSEGLIQLARKYPDVRFILDTKNHDLDIIRTLVKQAGNDPYVLDRFIPNVWDQPYYDDVIRIHRFTYTMLAMYRTLALHPDMNEDEIVTLARKNHITAIAMHAEDDPAMGRLQTGSTTTAEPFSLQRFQAKLRAAGIPAYVHSIRTQADTQKYRALDMGVYMDIPLQ